MLADKSNYDIKGLKNSWAAFLVASSQMLNETGVLAYILPYELLTVSYGLKMQTEILSNFERVDVFISDERAFKEIEQDAIVVIAQKKSTETHGFFINRVDCLSELSKPISNISVDHQNSKNIHLDLKGFLLNNKTLELLHRIRQKVSSIGDYTNSSPGLVTAANDFFIITKADAKKFNITEKCEPILKKGSYTTKSPIFTLEDYKRVEEKYPSQFLNFRGANSSDFSLDVLNYIKSGEELLYHNRFKCRNRTFWYEVPLVKKRKAFFLKRCSNYPRLIINEANVLITDTAYGLEPKESYSVDGLCFSFYNSLTLLFSEIDGRFYGGGVLELTPREFRGLPLVYKEPTAKQFSTFLKAHDKQGNTIDNLASFGDKWLKTKLKLNADEIRQIREAWNILRNHRLRHSIRKNK